MKREYISPVFIAELYSFTESIANCDVPEGKAPLLINWEEHLCVAGCDKGHVAGKGGLYTNPTDYPLTIFNDGKDIVWDKKDPIYADTDPEHKYPIYSGCDYDWTGDDKKFSQDFFGNSASSSDQHRPSYKGYPLQS